MRNSILIHCVFLEVLFASCNQNGEKHHSAVLDSIRVDSPKSFSVEDSSCFRLFNEYYSKFGISIQRYYDVEDSLVIDLNADGRDDMLVVLTPIPLGDTRRYNCLVGGGTNRIVVEVISGKGGSTIRNTYPNLVSNIGGVLSKYYGLQLTQTGFEIHHQSGSKYSWKYVTQFSTKLGDGLSLVKIQKSCSLEGNEIIEEYIYTDLNANDLNVNDTIKNNCHCDSIWNKLESNFQFR